MRRIFLSAVLALCWACGSESHPSPISGSGGSGGGSTGGGGTGGGTGGGGTGGGAKDSGSDAPDGEPGDSGADGDGPPAECNTLTPDGPSVAVTTQTGTAPVPAGGTITAGKYWLTERTRYAGASAPADVVRRTLVIDAKKISLTEQIDPADDAGTPTQHRSEANYTIYGVVLSTNEACPAPGAIDNITFSATGTELWLFPEPGARDVYVLK